MTINAGLIRAWVCAILTFFFVQTTEPVFDGLLQEIVIAAASFVYGFVAAYTLRPAASPRKDTPSAVRARWEAAQRRREAS